MSKQIVSPSRTYVALCNKANFDGFYCKKFVLPEEINWGGGTLAFANNTERASWYFLNVLDGVACVETVIPFEDYSNLRDADQPTFQPARQVCRYCGEYEPEDCICDWKRNADAAEAAAKQTMPATAVIA